MKDMIIDIHGHIGRIDFNPYADADAKLVEQICQKAGVDLCVVSSGRALMYDTFEGNQEVLEAIKNTDRLLGYITVNPLFPASIKDLEHIAGEKKIVGCKLHPEYHGYDLSSRKTRMFIDEIARHAQLILCHTSCMQGEVMATADKICRIAEDHPDVTFILAHLAGIYQNAIYPYYPNISGIERMSEYNPGNTYIDTAHPLMYVYPGVMERVLECVGPDKILFGTDIPLQQELQIGFAIQTIRNLDISEEDKRKILGLNARKILGI